MTDRNLIKAANAPTYAFNNNDWDAVRDSVTEDFVYDEVCTNRTAKGVENVIDLWKGWRVAFPDIHGTINNAFGSDGKVVKEITWEGTHTGPLPSENGDIPPTAKRFKIRSCEIWYIENGKGKKQIHYIDMVNLKKQLGLD